MFNHIKLSKINISLLPLYFFKYFLRISKYVLNKFLVVINRLERINLLTASHKNILKRNSKFKNKHKGKKAYVIVNGPSLAKQDISSISNDITFAVTGFYKHEIVSENWQPNYYSFLDENMFEQSQLQDNFFSDLTNKIKDSTFFLPFFRGYDTNKKKKYLPEDRTFFVAGIGDSLNTDDLTKVTGSLQGVGAFALLQAVYMGCSPIYLLGFDHDYMANRGFDHHFYQGGTMENHKLDQVTLGSRIPYDDEMLANAKLWKNYRDIKKIADKKGIKIYNSTGGGFLDVFPFKNFEETI
jgi:hypothetical protein